MKKLLLFVLLSVSCPLALVLESGCNHQVGVEAGGAYTEASLAVADQAILDASRTFTGFLDWHEANATFLAKWPEIAELAKAVASQKDAWIKNAYAARDAYAAALKAYKSAPGSTTEVDAKRAQLNSILALIDNVTTQIASYRSSHNV